MKASTGARALVSLVIPAYSCVHYPPAATQNVLTQDCRPMEIIVVDDGSTDDTQAVLGRYPEVACIRQPNGGLSNARNTGIKAARGEWIALLDADGLWLPEELLTWPTSLAARTLAETTVPGTYRALSAAVRRGSRGTR